MTKDGKDCVNPLFTANNTAAAYDAADSLHYKHKRENVTSTKVIVTSSNVYYTLRDRFNDLTFIQHIPTKIKRVFQFVMFTEFRSKKSTNDILCLIF